MDYPRANITLNLECINFKADIWINGYQLETHIGAFTPFKRRLPHSILKEKNNLLSIRVKSLQNSDNAYLVNLFLTTHWAKFPGIWGDVYLEKLPPIYIEKFYVKSDLRHKRVIVNIYPNSKKYGRFRVLIPELDIKAENKKPKISIQLQDFEKWTLENPKLYTLQVQLLTDDSDDYTDEITTKIGIRDFSIINRKFFFNFEEILLKAVYFDWLPYHLPLKEFSEENLKKYLTEIKESGFNSILSIDKPLPEKILQICDEIGIIAGQSTSFVHSDKSISTTSNTNSNPYFEQELAELFISYRNHPSFAWLFINTSASEKSFPTLVKTIRRLDRVRAITITKDILTPTRKSFSVTPFTVGLIPTEVLAFKPWLPANDHTLQWLEHLDTTNALQFILNYHFITSENPNTPHHLFSSQLEKEFKERDLIISFQSPQKLLENVNLVYLANFNSIIQSLRRNDNISGYCLFKFSIDNLKNFDNLAYILTISDSVKQTLKKYNQNLKILINLGKTNLLSSETTDIAVSITYTSNEFPVDQFKDNKLAEVLLQINSPSQQTLWRKKKLVRIKKDLYILYLGDISAPTTIGTHTIIGKFIVNNEVISETTKSFYVASFPNKTECPVEIIDPEKTFTKECIPLIEKISPLAPIIVLPPYSNTIFAYPDNELTMMLNNIKEGAIGIIFTPPNDWNQLKQQVPDLPEIQMQSIENYLNYIPFHYVKPHPIFMNLPTRQIMRLPYKNIVTKKFFLNKSDEDATGLILFPNSCNSEIILGTTLLILRYGVGRLVFTTLKILENLKSDPISQHIFVNLLNYFSRRAIPPEKPPLPIQNAVEFIRHKKNTAIRKWIVSGPFPSKLDNEIALQAFLNNPSKNGKRLNLTTIFNTEIFNTWFTNEGENHLLNLLEALDIQTYTHHLQETPLSALAFGEFNIPQKFEAIIQVKTPNKIKVWVNDTLIIENHSEHPEVKTYEARLILKSLKNTILVMCSREKGPLYFYLDFFDLNRKKMNIYWIN